MIDCTEARVSRSEPTEARLASRPERTEAGMRSMVITLNAVSIFDEVLQRLSVRKPSVVVLSERSQRIFTHYQRTWDRAKRKTPLYLDALVQQCIANLARSNGVDVGRTEVTL